MANQSAAPGDQRHRGFSLSEVRPPLRSEEEEEEKSRQNGEEAKASSQRRGSGTAGDRSERGSRDSSPHQQVTDTIGNRTRPPVDEDLPHSAYSRKFAICNVKKCYIIFFYPQQYNIEASVHPCQKGQRVKRMHHEDHGAQTADWQKKGEKSHTSNTSGTRNTTRDVRPTRGRRERTQGKRCGRLPRQITTVLQFVIK